MTGDQLQALGVLVAIVVGIAGVLLAAVQASRTADQARRDERQKDIDAAVKPVKDDLVAMTEDRNYWRNRANQYEDRAQSRGT